jgi:hypothetical protein
MSDISSAGIAWIIPGCGTACRRDVLGGVDVPVVPGAASGARPVPRGQGKLRERVPARRAGLARRIPPADHGQFPAVPLAFVLKLPAELTPAAVADGAGETPVADHVRDGEILDDDHVVVADEPGGGPVQVVAPGVANLTAGAGNLGFRLGPVRGAVPAAGQAPLVAGQLVGRVPPGPCLARTTRTAAGRPSSPARAGRLYRIFFRKICGSAPDVFPPSNAAPRGGAPDSSPA